MPFSSKLYLGNLRGFLPHVNPIFYLRERGRGRGLGAVMGAGMTAGMGADEVEDRAIQVDGGLFTAFRM